MSGRLGPHFAVRFWTPKRSVSGLQKGAVLSAKFFAAGRKIAQVALVSAGTRQKFCIPLGFHGSQRREQLFSTPCERFCHSSRTCLDIHVRRVWRTSGGRFVGKFFATGRKIAQVAIVSAGTRQKFFIPLGFHGSQRREQLFSTPCERLCPHMFLNWGGSLWRPWNPLRFWRWVWGRQWTRFSHAS